MTDCRTPVGASAAQMAWAKEVMADPGMPPVMEVAWARAILLSTGSIAPVEDEPVATYDSLTVGLVGITTTITAMLGAPAFIGSIEGELRAVWRSGHGIQTVLTHRAGQNVLVTLNTGNLVTVRKHHLAIVGACAMNQIDWKRRVIACNEF